MHFLIPAFLWALFALSIPIIIHLFRFKRFKTFHFSQIRWLKKLSEQQKSSRRLKHFLILTSRLLALVLMILAFAQPFFANDEDEGRTNLKQVLIFIDNTQSMMGANGGETAWNAAIQTAGRLVRSYPADHSFVVLSADKDPAAFGLLSQVEALQKIQSLGLTYNNLSWDEIGNKLQMAGQQVDFKDVFVLSDFQSDGGGALENWPSNVNLVQMTSGEMPDNISIDTLLFTSPPVRIGQILEVEVVVTNRGKGDASDILVEFELEDEIRDGLRIDLSAGESKQITLSSSLRRSGLHQGKIVIDDFPITFDDQLYFSFNVPEEIPVVLISEKSTSGALSRVFSDSIFNLSVFSPGNIQLSGLRSASAIVLNGISDLPGGVTDALLSSNARVFVIMPETPSESFFQMLGKLGVSSPARYREFSEPSILADIAWDDPLFYGVFERRESQPDLPKVKGGWVFSAGSGNAILSFADGKPFLFKQYAPNGAEVFVMATPMETKINTFGQHALLVPVFHNFALYAQGSQTPYFILGQNNSVDYPVKDPNAQLKIVLKDGSESIPSQRKIGQVFQVRWEDKPVEPGNFVLQNGIYRVGIISVNANRKESTFPRMNVQEIVDLFGHAPTSIKLDGSSEIKVAALIDSGSKSGLWWNVLLLAFIFATVEMMLIRFLP
ncbi:MAG: BatA domain-containing protein [Cryomorphaceae bacterium]|nr:BatA domain-containing protein [Cryomorphaceae bacterium]